jgi:2,4-dienoyl-CoA reductase-like NADH-dependent reductase (Old Yellow Enzyme family)
MTIDDPILQPLTIKNLTLKNRIVSTAHESAYSEDFKPKESYRLYHKEKAKGGIGLTFTGAANVSPDSPSAFGNIYASSDEVIPYFQKLAETVHEYDTAIMAQITHMGRRDIWAQEN